MRVLFPPLAKHAGSHRDFPACLGGIKRDPHSKASRTSCKLPRLGLFLFKGKIPLFPPLSYLVAHNTRREKRQKRESFFFVLVLCSPRVLRVVHSVWAFTHTSLFVFARPTPLKQSRVLGKILSTKDPIIDMGLHTRSEPENSLVRHCLGSNLSIS